MKLKVNPRRLSREQFDASFHSGQFRVNNWKLLLAYALVRVSCVCSLKTNSVDKKWSSSIAGRVLTLSFVIPFNTLQ